MKASIIISTLNRADFLAECLTALDQQSFRDFEVIVVRGPCTDHTDRVLALFKGRIKSLACDQINLSVSRNCGIAAASGDVCAFIDDDAIAHPHWLERILGPYRDPAVSAVGGFTLDHTGVSFQCRYTVCDRLGNAFYFDRIDPANFINFPGSPVYPSLLGTNSSFRRSELERIGGFDEVFAYMLDETDVCLRLNDIGGRVVTVADALILHRYAPSHTRNPERIPRSLLASARSKAYFCYKHRRSLNDLSGPIAEISKFAEELSFSNRWFVDHEKISPAHFMRLTQELEAGVNEGTALGIRERGARDWLAAHGTPAARHFTPFASARPERPLRICLVSQGYPPTETAGIARWTASLAGGLVRLGHAVHVIAATGGAATLEYHAGVWVHRIPNAAENGISAPLPVPGSIYRRALAVHDQVLHIRKTWGLDVVSAPIWDAEGLVCAEHLDIPVVTSLHTTYKLALPYKEHWRNDLEYRRNHVNRIIDAETWLLRNSALILANSQAIVEQIQAHYPVTFKPARLAVVPHGVEAAPPGFAPEARQAKLAPEARPGKLAPEARPGKLASKARPAKLAPEARRGARTRFLFVGRLECRKGIDLLLAAIVPVLQDHPDIDLYVVGEEVLGDPVFDETLSELRSRIEMAGLGPRVRFTGYVSDEELLQQYAACDVFVAPSRFESFGLIAIEAMRLGKPVIAANAGGLGEIFQDRIDGLLFESENVESLRQALEALASDTRLRHDIADAGYDTYMKKFTVEAMAEGVADAFDKLVFGGKSSREARSRPHLQVEAAD